MRRSRVPVLEKRSSGSNTKYNSSLRGTTSTGPKITKTNFSVNMVSTRSTAENRAKEGTEGERVEPTIEIDLETPDQSVDETRKMATESTPMPNAEEPNQKPIEFSPIDDAEDAIGNTEETVKEDSQVKRTSFTEKLGIMFGIKTKENVTEEPKAERARTFGTVSTKTSEANPREEQAKAEATAEERPTADHEETTIELGDLLAKLNQIDKRLKHSKEDREVIKKEIRYNKNEYLDSYFNLAKATDERLKEMSDKVEATNEEREKNIKTDMQQLKNRYDDVNSQLGSLERRMDTMSKSQAESSCAIQAKLDAILRGSTPQERPAADRTQSTRVDFVEPQRNKRQSTPLPLTRDAISIAPTAAKTIMKNGTSNTTTAPGDSTANSNTGPDAMTWASTWEMMNRTLEAFATRNTDSSDRREGKSRKTFKKPKEFKDDSDGCIDTWVEVMRLHIEQDNLSDERQACTAILSNLEGTALKCVVAKKEEERDTADKIFEILLKGFGSGMKGHQAMMRFEKRRQRDDESIDRFLDDLESLRRRSDPEESTNRRNFSIASKLIDGVKSDDLRTMLATYYTLSKDSAPTPEEMRQKSREYMLMKPKKYSYSENRNTQGGSQPQRSSWYKPRDDMDKRRSCANCGSADHHVADCTTYKQGMKSLGYAPDEEDMSQMEEHEYYNGLIIKIGARCFFCNQEGHFRMDCPLFWEAVKDQNHPKHKLALAAVQNQRNRQNEFESRNLGAPNTELPTKTVKAVTHVSGALESAAGSSLEINYEKAATEAIAKVKQDLAAKEIEQRLKLEIERQNFNEALTGSNSIPEARTGSMKTGNCNTVKMVTGKPFGISKIGARIMSIITVGGHEVTRNLSEPSDQTIMHIDVYADYLSGISPQTTSRALRALLTRGGSKSVRVDNRYTEAYGPHEVMLNIDGINIYTKTMITCDEDLIGQIYVGKEELKVRSIGHCAMLEEDAMHIGTEADVTGHVLDINGKKTQLRGLLDTGAVLSVIPIETWEKMGFDKGDLIDSRIRLSAANKGALRVLGRTPIIALNLGERNLWMSFIVVENLDESDQFILGRDFIRNFDVTIDLNNAMFRIRNPDRRYAIKPVNLIMANENKAPVFLSRRVRLKANEAAIVSLRMKNYNELSDNKQVCIVPNPNSQSAAVLGRSFSITKSGLCVSVLLNTLDIPITIQRGRKLGYALPVKTRYETIENSKQNEVVDCPNRRDKICILRRLQRIKDSSSLIKSLKSETDDGLSSCSNFPERPTLDEMQTDKPVLPEIEHLRGKLKDEQLEAIKDVLERNEEVFSRHKADIGCCNFVEHEIELEENAVPHREGARRMTPHKSDACRKEIETLLEYDMIEPSKSPWACGVVMAKKKGDQLRFCCDFRYLNYVTVKDAYPIPRIDESLSKLGDAKFFTTLDLGSAFWQVPLRKQDRDKTGFACELGLFQWKRMPFGLCNATATFQRLMAHALIGVTKKYGNLVMCYVDDVVIATPTLEDHIERLDEVFACMKRSGLKCKPSKCEILKDSIKYLGRMVDKHGIRPDPDAVEAVLTWKSPKTEHQLMSFLGFANYYREFIKGYADKVYPMQKLMRHKGKKFTWNNAAEESFQRIKKELCEAPVLGMPTEKGMYVLDTDASVVAISGILHQEQEWNGKTVLRPIAYGSKVLSDTEMKYGAPKAEMFAVVTFVEKYRAYLGSEPFKLRVDNRALSWLKTYSMDQSYIGRWIVRLDGYNMIIEHRTRDKHQNADSLSKKTEFYERQEQREADRPEIKDGFSFMDKETYDSLPLTRWLDKSGKPIEDHPELPKEPLEKTILKKSRGIPIGIMLKSKIVRETLKAKGYDLIQVEEGTVRIDEDLMRLLEKLSDDKPVIQGKGQEAPELTILRREETVNNTDVSKGSITDSKEVVRSLVEKIPEKILEQTKVRDKKVTFREEVEHLGLDQESGEWSRFMEEDETGEGKLSGEREEWDEDSDESSEDQDSLCMILAEEKIRQHDRELQTDPSSGTYNLEIQEVRGGEELEKIAVSRKPLRELSCNSNVRTNLVPEDDMKIVKRMICVKLSDDIHNPGEMNGQIMALKEHVKARYRLSDLIRAQKNDKMTSNLSKWIHSGVKEKGELEEDSYKILSQFYKEKRDLLYHTAEGVVACKRRDEEKILHKHNLIILPQLYQTEVLFRSHDQMGHQGIDKVQQRILHRFDWPGMRKACERWVNACLACLQVKDPRKMKFPLKSVESSESNEVVQIDHQKICMTESGYNQILVIIDHFTKLAEAVPCQTASAEETCDHLITHWISRYGCPMTFQSDNGKAFVGGLDKRIDEEITHCSSALDDLSSTDQWVGRETEQDTGQHAQGVLLEIHDGLGQIPATGSRSL